MLAKPEDRTAAVAKLVEQAGGKLIGFYMLFGEYDWMSVSEMPSGKEAAAAALTAAGVVLPPTRDHAGDDGGRGESGVLPAKRSAPPTELRARPDDIPAGRAGQPPAD